MPTTTWQTARDDIQRPLGHVAAATTTDITTDTNVVSTNLADDYTVDDAFIGWYIIIRGTNNALVVRRVKDYTASSGTLSVAGAALSAESGAVSFDLYRFHPERCRDWFNRVRQNMFPQLAIVRDHQPLVTGQVQRRFQLPTTIRDKPVVISLGQWPDAAGTAENEITDPGFEDWASATSLNSWTLAGTGSTVNQETQTTSPSNYAVFNGTYSARILNNSSDTTTLLQTVTPTVAAERVESNFGMAVYNTQTAVNVALYLVAALSSTGAIHGGTGWELLSGTATLGEVTTVAVGISIPSATAFSTYVDEAILILGQSEGVVPYWEPLLNWDWVPNVAGASNNGYIEFPYNLPQHHVLRIVARDMISSVSADTDTLELDGELLEPVYDMVRAELCQEAATVGVMRPAETDFWIKQAAFYRNRSKEAMPYRHISLPNPRIKVPDWSW